MFPEKFKAFEEKIRLTAELVARLKLEKAQLERDKEELEKRLAEGEQRISELEGEVKRLRTEGYATTPPIDPLFQPFNTRHGDLQEQTVHRLTETLGKEPNNVKALFELGTVYERQGTYDQAIDQYRKVLRINPDFVDAIEHLAFLLEKLNRDHEASPLWERILSLKKRD
jgi:tetratricopeptide (TPR) repeat protein